MKILGLSAFYHDSAAALVQDGAVLAAVEEERLSRRKHDSSFPQHAVRFCLESQNVKLGDLDAVVFYDKPFLKFERILEMSLRLAPKGYRAFLSAMPTWLTGKLHMKSLIRKELAEIGGIRPQDCPPVYFVSHHHSHAASAFYPSPFQDAAVLCVDGVGEWATTSLWSGQGTRLHPISEIHYPDSLGLLYSAITGFLGFKVNSGEYKVMGLAPYGEPIYADRIFEKLIDVKEDGSFRLNGEYFDFLSVEQLHGPRFAEFFDGPARSPESPFTKRDENLAASIQKVLEIVMIRLAKTARERTGHRALCLAGGVALNCVANAAIRREKIFDSIWVQPAAGDAGGAIGCALALSHEKLDVPRLVSSGDGMRSALLGPRYTVDQIQVGLDSVGGRSEVLSDEDLYPRVAKNLASGQVVGWFSGSMEFGPRALGSRSILADPRHPEMRRILNEKIKLRELFRPFAPAVLAESKTRYFQSRELDPYMLFTDQVRDGVNLPSITHVDGSARVQTVESDRQPRFHALIKEFEKLTGVGVLINTSFNVRGEPIVCTPQDAYRCFMHTEMDVLVLENHYLEKTQQPVNVSWERQIELD